MARRGQHSFAKRQKEIKRKQKAEGKIARRQNKKQETADLDEEENAEPQEDQEWS